MWSLDSCVFFFRLISYGRQFNRVLFIKYVWQVSHVEINNRFWTKQMKVQNNIWIFYALNKHRVMFFLWVYTLSIEMLRFWLNSIMAKMFWNFFSKLDSFRKNPTKAAKIATILFLCIYSNWYCYQAFEWNFSCEKNHWHFDDLNVKIIYLDI